MVVVTPTCDRPVALRLACRWMAQQIVQPARWVVVDGGSSAPVDASILPAYAEIIRPAVMHRAGPQNFLTNWDVGLRHARAICPADDTLITCWEDDDYYAPTHLAIHQRIAADEPHLAAIGDDGQRYYHLPTRTYRVFQNKGSALCQTSIRASAIPILLRALADCQRRSSYGLDALFWSTLPATSVALAKFDTVVGMKGLPGQSGLGIGHRPRGPWQADRDHARLRSWVGESAAEIYCGLLE